ncbi:MAG TPA: translation elongation factor Ts, partial [bacterium]|nr:translation elongation factor Ts [bacterium]
MTYTPTAADVKTLRESTMAGMLDCKRALVETEGDMEAAKDWLRAKGLAAAAKKAERAANAGLIYSYIRPDGQVGALVEVNCETDFVAANPIFQGFVNDLAKLIADQNPVGVEEPNSSNVAGESLLNLNWKGNPQENVGQALQAMIGTIGENMVIRRYARFDLQGTPGIIDSYIHLGGKVGVLVEFVTPDPGAMQGGDFGEFRKDIAMHIAAASPEYIHSGEISQETLDRERKI